MKVWGGFVVFVVLSGSRWVLATYFPSELPPIFEQSLHELGIACFFGALGLWRREREAGGADYAWLAVLGGLLLAVPSVLLVFARGGVSGTSGLVALTLVPVVMVFLEGQRALGPGGGQGVRRLLLPALAGVAGALLLIPIQLPGSAAGRMWLGLLAVSSVGVAWASVQFYLRLRVIGTAMAVAVLFGASGVVTGVAGLVRYGTGLPAAGWIREVLFCVLVDGPLAWLMVWLLKEMRPLRLSSRFLLVPLASVLEGMALAHVRPDWTMWLGGLLLLGGAGYLIKDCDSETESTLSLR